MALRETASLTPRQRDVLARVRLGLSNREIASDLGITEDGVKTHLSRLFLRYGVSNRISLLGAAGEWNNGNAAPVTLHALQGTSRAARDELDERYAPSTLTPQIQRIHDALEIANLAFEVVADLPPEASAKVVDAARKRLSAAFAALDELQKRIEV